MAAATMTAMLDVATITGTGIVIAIATATAMMNVAPLQEALLVTGVVTRIGPLRTPTVITTTVPRTQDATHPAASSRSPLAPMVITLLLQAIPNLLHRCLFPAMDHTLHRAISLSESTSLQEYKTRMTLIVPTRGSTNSLDRMGPHRRLAARLLARINPPIKATSLIDVVGDEMVEAVGVAEAAVMFVSRLPRGPC